MKHTIVFILILFQGFAFKVSAQQDMPDKISLGKNASMPSSGNRLVKATKSIQFKAGFKARAGCYLFASITAGTSDLGSDISLTETLNPLSRELGVFPNSVDREIYIQGNFENDALYIFDSSGNLQSKIFIHGKDPIVDLPTMNEGIYYLRVKDKMTRIVKE